MSWNFKMSEVELEKRFWDVVQAVDAVMTSKMLKYFEIFEAGAIPNIYSRLAEQDLDCTGREDWDGIATALDKFQEEMQTMAKRVSRGLQNSEKARIHILKSESGVSEEKYRELIQRIGGVSSSRDLVYWEGMILIRALTRIKERKYGKVL